MSGWAAEGLGFAIARRRMEKAHPCQAQKARQEATSADPVAPRPSIPYAWRMNLALSLITAALAGSPQTGEVIRGRPPVALCTVPEIDFVAVVTFGPIQAEVTEDVEYRHRHIHRDLTVQKWIWGDRPAGVLHHDVQFKERLGSITSRHDWPSPRFATPEFDGATVLVAAGRDGDQVEWNHVVSQTPRGKPLTIPNRFLFWKIESDDARNGKAITLETGDAVVFTGENAQRIGWIDISHHTAPDLESILNTQARAIDFDTLVSNVESACSR